MKPLPGLGWIMQWHKDTKNHSVKVACELHKNCVALRTRKKLHDTFEDDMMAWLHAGLQLIRRVR